MSVDTFTLIFDKLRTDKIKTLSADLYYENLTLSYEQIYPLCSNQDRDIRNLARALLITKCEMEEFEYDKGFNYIKEGVKLMEELPEETDCIMMCLDSVLVKIELTDSVERFLEVAEVVSKLFKDKKDAICHARANTKIASLLWERAAKITDNYDPNQMKEALELMKTLKDLGFEFLISSSVIINEILNQFEGKLNEETNLTQSAIEFYPLVKLLKSFGLEAETKSKFDELYSMAKKYKIKKHKAILNEQLIKVELIQVDPNELIYDSTNTSFARTTHNFQVAIYYGKYRNREVAIKMYKKLKDTTSMEKVYNEIRVYQLLGNYSSHENCFLKYYGSVFDGDRCFLVMDYLKNDLMKYITYCHEIDFEWNEIQLVSIIRKLIESFAEMEAMNIYHGDIKPHNLLIDEFSNIKIIDFGISVERNEDLTSTGTNTEYLLQGTFGYRAPEIEDKLLKGEKKGRFKQGLADVFSLGMVLLQLITLVKVDNLNTTAANPDLMNRVNQVKFEWAKNLLSNMLCANPKKRLRFKQLLAFIKEIETRTLTQQEL